MKILHINITDYGGAGIAALRLHKALLDNGIDSNFLCLIKISEETPYCQKFVQKKAFWLFRLLHRLGLVRYAHERNTEYIKGKAGNYERFSFPATDYDITRHPLIKEADIIHFHWVAGFVDWHSFFKKIKKPMVWTLHDMNPFLGGFHYLTDRDRNTVLFQGLEENFISIKINALKDFKNLHIVCPSKWMLSQSMHSKILGKYPHYLIPNNVPFDVFNLADKLKSRVALNLPTDKKIILFVAASLNNPRKGFDLLIKALDCLDRKEYALVVVGHNSSHDFHHAENIYLLGNIADDALLAAAYSSADVFVIPSIEDNLPNTIIESLACGTPVVGFNIGGIPDMVLNGFNGFIADKMEPNELYQMIIKALHYNFDKQKISRDAEKRFGPNEQVTMCLDLYRSLVNN